MAYEIPIKRSSSMRPSISIACCLDEVEDVTREDLEHIQDQITVMENYFGVKSYENVKNN